MRTPDIRYTRAVGILIVLAASAILWAGITGTGGPSGKEEGAMTEKAMFAAGCFWGVEATFAQVDGVVNTTVGYSGGHIKDPTYRQVCTDTTGHAETVLVEFNPDKVAYDKLLAVFWRCHDPTTPNRQGLDVGAHYRSVIFAASAEQRRAAEKSRDKLAESGAFRRSIVTEITDSGPFYRAEDYHQQYYRKRGMNGCGIR